jgi:AraC-like DNA-binding protein
VRRRLDRAKRLIRAGTTLAEVAVASGFADQSHLTRHFKKAYGLSPGRWSGMLI